MHSADCGAYSSCELLAAGCTGTAAEYLATGKAKLNSDNGITVMQDVDTGYTETLCVKCKNSVDATTQHNNFVIT